MNGGESESERTLLDARATYLKSEGRSGLMGSGLTHHPRVGSRIAWKATRAALYRLPTKVQRLPAGSAGKDFFPADHPPGGMEKRRAGRFTFYSY